MPEAVFLESTEISFADVKEHGACSRADGDYHWVRRREQPADYEYAVAFVTCATCKLRHHALVAMTCSGRVTLVAGPMGSSASACSQN